MPRSMDIHGHIIPVSITDGTIHGIGDGDRHGVRRGHGDLPGAGVRLGAAAGVRLGAGDHPGTGVGVHPGAGAEEDRIMQIIDPEEDFPTDLVQTGLPIPVPAEISVIVPVVVPVDREYRNMGIIMLQTEIFSAAARTTTIGHMAHRTQTEATV